MRLLIVEGVNMSGPVMQQIVDALHRARTASKPTDVVLNAGKENCVIHVLKGEFGEPVPFQAGGVECIAIGIAGGAQYEQIHPDDGGKLRIPVLVAPSGGREDGLRGPMVGRKPDERGGDGGTADGE